MLLTLASIAFLLSCGEEGTTTAPCTNCEYWSKPFGRIGRFPTWAPDGRKIAYCDTLDTVGGEGPGYYYHIWVAVLGDESDTTRFYQVTSGAYDDLRPVWSPDGDYIAFERRVGEVGDIYVVNVSDLESPGDPIRVTDRDIIPESNLSPAWINLNGETWIGFSNSTSGGNDYDLAMVPFPSLDSLVWLTEDPADYAEDEGGVLSYVFKDQQVGGNGSDLLTFISPERAPVGNLRVVAKCEESSDTLLVQARIVVNGKDSGLSTPYTFRYRPTGLPIVVEGILEGYCTRARQDTFYLQANATTTIVLDFVHTHGTLAVRSIFGGLSLYIDDELQTERVPSDSSKYAYYECVTTGQHRIYGLSYGGRSSDTLFVEVNPGETTYVRLTPAETGPSRVSVGSRRMSHGERFEPVLTARRGYSLWIMDLSSGFVYEVYVSNDVLSSPALSPDGNYIAFIEGSGTSRHILVADISNLLSGGTVTTVMVGLPGSSEDIECFRIPERIQWYPDPTERKIVASLSTCRGGAIPGDYHVWIGDLSSFIE